MRTPGRKRRKQRYCPDGRHCPWCGPIARVKRDAIKYGARHAIRQRLARLVTA